MYVVAEEGVDAISIHAPVKSATNDGDTWIPDIGDFNPRARKERDLSSILDHVTNLWISIHAPVKSATSTR